MSRHSHPQVLALLQAAKETPEDDAPRQALADWLEEHDDYVHAELIRLQLLLAPGSSLEPEQRDSLQQREQDLLTRHGGAWLGPLWQHGGRWHRGLLSFQLDRPRAPPGFEDMLPWIDSIHFEVTGKDALRISVALLSGLNHATLSLRRPFLGEVLLSHFGGGPPCPFLRTLTFCWSPGMGRQGEESPVVNLPEDFFARLLRLPPCRQLTHLGSILALTSGQEAVLRSAGVEPVRAWPPHWPHDLPPAALRR